MKKVSIQNIRNIGSLEFQIPLPGLHIIAGKNGTGKTTLFTCLSRINNSNAYRQGFPTSDGNMFDAYSGTISYTANGSTVIYSRRSSGEWRPNRNTTTLQDFGYPRVFNITTKGERVFTQDVISPRNISSPDNWLNEKMNTIFDTDKFSSMKRITTGDLRGRGVVANNRRRNTAYAIPIDSNGYYTERSFSFGEIVVLNLLHDVKNVQNGSLILIDELELALHPSAQIRIISCLRDLAREKGLTIIISTHSASIIKAEKEVILLEQSDESTIEVIYNCPPAKAIGAIGMREDTMPDIVVLLEDKMAKGLFFALMQQYNKEQGEKNYLDVRMLEIGGFPNIINFYTEAHNYMFYDNVYVTSFMDKDVETDIIPYDRFGNQELIRQYNENRYYLRFLPYTPEVLLIKTFISYKNELLDKFRSEYSNQQLQYSVEQEFDFEIYESPFPDFRDQNEYNNYIRSRGAFRKKCKEEAERIAKSLANQINQSVYEVYRFTFKIAVERITSAELNIIGILAPTMKRLAR